MQTHEAEVRPLREAKGSHPDSDSAPITGRPVQTLFSKRWPAASPQPNQQTHTRTRTHTQHTRTHTHTETDTDTERVPVPWGQTSPR